eukprot:TRINITY_DN6434_c0_g1_i10.p1 TRINITY_DN6434_c0_g1~~TRINITY_DN6434_c0_g1_i10.p1  ORF type:complete len:384 (-),score=104.89 TRINITY_DN6434_c0_g1_i10:813-1964(-)
MMGSAPEGSAQPLIEGMIEKSTEGWLFQRYQHKWFQLFPDRLQYHSITDKDIQAGKPETTPPADAIKQVHLHCILDARIKRTMNEFTLVSSSRTFELKANSNLEAQTWVNAVQAQLKVLRAQLDTPLLHGWLEKKKDSPSMVAAPYMSRYFVLTEEYLFYFKQVPEGRASNRWHDLVENPNKHCVALQDMLSVSTVKSAADGKYEFSAALESKMWKLRFETRNYALDWADNIQAALSANQDPIHYGAEHLKSAKLLSQSAMLTPRILRQLWLQLPKDLQVRKWSLAFSLEQDGASLGTLYHKIKDRGSNLMIIQDTLGSIFGVFAPECWSPTHRLFYGRGLCFIFKINQPNGTEDLVSPQTCKPAIVVFTRRSTNGARATPTS